MTPVRRFQVGLAAAFLLVAALAVGSLPRHALAASSSPKIDSLSPATGPFSGGTTVTLSGSDFQPGVTVRFGAQPVLSLVRVSATQLTFTTPQGPSSNGGPVDVVLTNPDGGVITREGGFFYAAFAPPLVFGGLEPTTGPNSGGTTVTITGTGFSFAVAVYFGDVPAANINPLGSSVLIVRTPANVSGAVDVSLVNPDGGTVVKKNAFTYTGDVRVGDLVPGGGSSAGGARVLVQGDGFRPGATVQFGGAAATDVVVVNSTQIVATTPAGSAGPTSVRVTNPGGTSASRDSGFTYGPTASAVLPTISGVSTAAGPTTGGQQVTLTGTGFSGGAAVYFGGIPSPLVSWSGASSMFAQTPASLPGAVDVTVVNRDGGTTTLPKGYTYQGGPGTTITSMTPGSGDVGTVVVINGSGFNTGSWVTFGGIPARSTTMLGVSQLVAIVPAGASGAVSVAVQHIGSTTPTTAPTQFTVTGSTPPVTTPPVTPPVTPPASGGAGGFVTPPRFSASGQALVIFGGGTADQLESAASAAGATGVWVQDATGAYQLLVVGGPAFLKDQFRAQFPSGIGANTPASLTR